MKTSELIALLQEKVEIHGDVDCYTNGEYGQSESIEMTTGTVSFDSAEHVMDNWDDHGLSGRKTILHIGGY